MNTSTVAVARPVQSMVECKRTQIILELNFLQQRSLLWKNCIIFIQGIDPSSRVLLIERIDVNFCCWKFWDILGDYPDCFEVERIYKSQSMQNHENMLLKWILYICSRLRIEIKFSITSLLDWDHEGRDLITSWIFYLAKCNKTKYPENVYFAWEIPRGKINGYLTIPFWISKYFTFVVLSLTYLFFL